MTKKNKTVCFIDQSGSMSHLLSADLLKLLPPETDIDLYLFDHEVSENSHFVYKHEKPWRLPNYYFSMAGYTGGTSYRAIAEFCIKKDKWSNVIIVTDGYAPAIEKDLDAKILWIIHKSGFELAKRELVREGDSIICFGE
jgi:predicted metal-dependent peptidase